VFKINEKIEIIEKGNVYKSTIQDIRGEKVFIDLPMSGSTYYMMH
jgi:hypothetical protein